MFMSRFARSRRLASPRRQRAIGMTGTKTFNTRAASFNARPGAPFAASACTTSRIMSRSSSITRITSTMMTGTTINSKTAITSWCSRQWAVSIAAGPTTYYYLDGIFYVAQNDSFAVVNPPAGIIVPDLPSGANQVVVNGNVCYQFNGLNYQPSVQDGVTVYTVNPM
jgi:hypothetical protein